MGQVTPSNGRASQQQIQQLEDPVRANPTWETIESIAAALGRRARVVFD